MAWGALITNINGNAVTIKFYNDVTGQLIEQIAFDDSTPNWAADYVAKYIVNLTNDPNSFSAGSKYTIVGYVTPTPAIVGATPVSPSTNSPKTTPVSSVQAQAVGQAQVI